MSLSLRSSLRSILAAAVTFAGVAHAGQITIITSFPKELTAVYKTAFEKKYPDIKVEILNKNTNSGITYVRETAAGQRPDIFWASAPDAFEVLAHDRLLAKLTDVGNTAIPDKIGNYPVNDPQGFYKGQAFAGYGLMWNTRYMQANKLPAPAEWSDLTKSVYFGHVAISSPSRSGTTHLTVETILQGEGWDKGWSQMLQIAGNCAAVTERSFGVPDGVNNGQFGIGIVIDFFGLAGKYSNFPVEFVYPSVTAIVPANIALVDGSKNPADAKTFINYTLSDAGQQLLLDPKLSRLPVLPSTYAKAPAGYPNAFEIAKKAKVQFNSDLSSARYHVVSALFDQTITFRLKELQAATKAIHDAEKKLAAKPNAKAAELVKQARTLAFSSVIGQQAAGNQDFLKLFATKIKDAKASKKLSDTEEEWNSKAKANYENALKLAQQAIAL